MIGFLNGNGQLENKEASVNECKDFLRGYVREDELENVDLFVYHLTDGIVLDAIKNVDYDISLYPWSDVFDDLKHTFEYGGLIEDIEREFGIEFHSDDISIVEDMIATYVYICYFRHHDKLSV